MTSVLLWLVLLFSGKFLLKSFLYSIDLDMPGSGSVLEALRDREHVLRICSYWFFETMSKCVGLECGFTMFRDTMADMLRLFSVNKALTGFVQRSDGLWLHALGVFMYDRHSSSYRPTVCKQIAHCVEHWNEYLTPSHVVTWLSKQGHVLKIGDPTNYPAKWYKFSMLRLLFFEHNTSGPDNKFPDGLMHVPQWENYTLRDIFPGMPAHIIDDTLTLFRVQHTSLNKLRFWLNTAVWLRAPNSRGLKLYVAWEVYKNGKKDARGRLKGYKVGWGPFPAHDAVAPANPDPTRYKGNHNPECLDWFPGQEHLRETLKTKCIEVTLQQGDILACLLGVYATVDRPVEELFWNTFAIGSTRVPDDPSDSSVVTTEQCQQALAVVQDWKNKFLPQ
jgi:hypothetical protein